LCNLNATSWESAVAERQQALQLLRQALCNLGADFRDGQWDAIDAVVNKSERRLVVERTGWGKSSVYFIATKLLRAEGKGPTLIISPLLALMRNQIDSATAYGIKAETLNSSNPDDHSAIFSGIDKNEIDVLLISPERLANSEFVEKVLIPISQNIGMLVVDEAHCISDWGHDFRPDYRRLVSILQHMPKTVSILGTTATANNRVIEDIKSQLGDVVVQRGPLIRESLLLQTIVMSSQAARLAWLAQVIPEIDGAGIVYTLTTKDAEQIADWLTESGIDAKAYHGHIMADGFENSADYKIHLEREFLANNIKVLVATSALGMGYDKPDLSFVFHYQAPASIITYYQQVGRAGRGIPSAYGVLLMGNEDEKINDFFRKNAFPKTDWIDSVLELLEQSDGLSVPQIETCLNLRKSQIQKVLKFLSVESPSPIVKSGSRWFRTPNQYKFDTEKVTNLTTQRLTEWYEIQEYVEHSNCLMRFLASVLDDPNPKDCGQCENCLGHPIFIPEIQHDMGVKSTQFLKHSEKDLHCGVLIPKGAFSEYALSGKLPEELRASVGKTLSRWGDAGWGEMVRSGKQAGKFDMMLVDAVVDMIANRWTPDPAPTWITCIPSTNNPKLVPRFAQQVAEGLSLPFHAIVGKLKNNPPQKLQENRFHQCKNLDGVFSVEKIPIEGPVILIDDVVDSGMTLTVVSALLLQAGCGEVLPLALASSKAGE